MQGNRLPRCRSVSLPESARPLLFVVVDTEEEFDWEAPYSRRNVAVTAMRSIERGQLIFDRFGVKPTYVVDYPVASQREGFEPLQEIAGEGRCTIGAHLHPWVNPPFDEDVTTRNSFTMNLPTELQRSKLTVLSSVIEEHLQVTPTVFKAGRYGLGSDTVSVLDESGFTIDMSVCPRYDFSDQCGPSYVHFDASPFFLTPRLLEVPCTVDYTGWAGGLRPTLHRRSLTATGIRVKATGILSRLGAANRIMLSPEGNTFEEMRDLAAALVQRGCRTLTLSYHSPSLAPGHTPYVRTQQDLDVFLRSIESFCSFFFTDLNGVAATPTEFRTDFLSSSPGLYE